MRKTFSKRVKEKEENKLSNEENPRKSQKVSKEEAIEWKVPPLGFADFSDSKSEIF